MGNLYRSNKIPSICKEYFFGAKELLSVFLVCLFRKDEGWPKENFQSEPPHTPLNARSITWNYEPPLVPAVADVDALKLSEIDLTVWCTSPHWVGGRRAEGGVGQALATRVEAIASKASHRALPCPCLEPLGSFGPRPIAIV